MEGGDGGPGAGEGKTEKMGVQSGDQAGTRLGRTLKTTVKNFDFILLHRMVEAIICENICCFVKIEKKNLQTVWFEKVVNSCRSVRNLKLLNFCNWPQ